MTDLESTSLARATGNHTLVKLVSALSDMLRPSRTFDALTAG